MKSKNCVLILVANALLAISVSGTVNAEYILEVRETIDGDLVGIGTGSFDLSAATLGAEPSAQGSLVFLGGTRFGVNTPSLRDDYDSIITLISGNAGPELVTAIAAPSSVTGNTAFVNTYTHRLLVDDGYASNSAMSASFVIDGGSLASIGRIDGETVKYSWPTATGVDTYEVRFLKEVPPPTLACVGFDSPMDNPPVSVKKNRALPLKATLLFDESGFLVTDSDIVSPPVLQVIFSSAFGASPIDVTENALAAGKSSEGNIFSYDSSGGRWKYNIKTSNYTAAGTYTVKIASGDSEEYSVQSCETSFVID